MRSKTGDILARVREQTKKHRDEDGSSLGLPTLSVRSPRGSASTMGGCCSELMTGWHKWLNESEESLFSGVVMKHLVKAQIIE